MLKMHFQGRKTSLFNEIPKLLCLLYVKVLYRVGYTLKRQCYYIIRKLNICMYCRKLPRELISGVPSKSKLLFSTDTELTLATVVLFKWNFKE